jgi:hypothetical protein
VEWSVQGRAPENSNATTDNDRSICSRALSGMMSACYSSAAKYGTVDQDGGSAPRRSIDKPWGVQLSLPSAIQATTSVSRTRLSHGNGQVPVSGGHAR